MGFDCEFGMVPGELFDHPWLTKNARLVYAALTRHRNRDTGVCKPSIDTLESYTRLSRRAVTSAIRELAAFGCVVVHQRRRGTKQRNHYTLPDPAEWRPMPEADRYIERACEKSERMRAVRAARQVSDDSVTHSDGSRRAKVSYAGVTTVSDGSVTHPPKVSDGSVTGVSYAGDTGTDNADIQDSEKRHTRLDSSDAFASAAPEPEPSTPEPVDEREVVADLLAGMLGRHRPSPEPEPDDAEEWPEETEQEVHVDSDW